LKGPKGISARGLTAEPSTSSSKTVVSYKFKKLSMQKKPANFN
jgi:hypothetical protein